MRFFFSILTLLQINKSDQDIKSTKKDFWLPFTTLKPNKLLGRLNNPELIEFFKGYDVPLNEMQSSKRFN